MKVKSGKAGLKNIGLKVKSRKKEFDKEIDKLLANYQLPQRFHSLLSFFIRFNKFPLFTEHVDRAPIQVFKDKGVYRIFIEVFADTKLENTKKSWKSIEDLKKKYPLLGAHLLRYRDFYILDGLEKKDFFVIKNGKVNDRSVKNDKTEDGFLVDRDGNKISQEALDGDSLNIKKYRHREFKKRYWGESSGR